MQAPNGNTTVFCPFQMGVTVFNKTNITIIVTNDASLNKWKDNKRFKNNPIDKFMDLSIHTTALDMPILEEGSNGRELPTIERIIRYLHTA